VRKRPFFAARIEKQINRQIGVTLRRFGWHDTVVAYTGYGNEERLRVLGRVILAPKGGTGLATIREEVWGARRGWRNFVSIPAVNRAVQVSVGGQVTDALTDRNGYVDITVSRHGLHPGWHHVHISTGDCEPTEAPILIIGDDVRFGIISDIDDTIITSYLPRLMIAAYNSFILQENARVPVAGMSQMFSQILRKNPGAPLIYLSTGAWTTKPFLERFIGRHGYPSGPMLLTDWGPTHTGWFRSGPAHKRAALMGLARDFPNIQWLLIGDDGQHDPGIYAEFARKKPQNVAGIAIRELPSMEQVLAHGTTTELAVFSSQMPTHIREVRAHDGYLLLPLIQQMLDERISEHGSQ
jgi:phosphatidate phosphatase APP1